MNFFFPIPEFLKHQNNANYNILKYVSQNKLIKEKLNNNKYH